MRTMTNEEAIRIIQTYIDVKSESEAEALELVIKALEDRPQGEWIKMSDRYGIYFACNKCGYDREKSITNFCPVCGTRLKGGAE